MPQSWREVNSFFKTVRSRMPGRLGKSQVQQGKGPSRAVSGRTPFNGNAKAFVEGKGAPVLLVAVTCRTPPDGMPDEQRAYAMTKALWPHEEHFQHGASEPMKPARPLSQAVTSSGAPMAAEATSSRIASMSLSVRKAWLARTEASQRSRIPARRACRPAGGTLRRTTWARVGKQRSGG